MGENINKCRERLHADNTSYKWGIKKKKKKETLIRRRYKWEGERGGTAVQRFCCSVHRVVQPRCCSAGGSMCTSIDWGCQAGFCAFGFVFLESLRLPGTLLDLGVLDLTLRNTDGNELAPAFA